MTSTKKYAKNNVWQVMNHTGFGPLTIHLDSFSIVLSKYALKKNGELKKEVATLLQEATCESMMKLHVKYGAIINMSADAFVQNAA